MNAVQTLAGIVGDRSHRSWDRVLPSHRRLRAQILDMLDPEWRRRQPARRREDERVLRRAAAILRGRGHGLLGDVVEAAANVC